MTEILNDQEGEESPVYYAQSNAHAYRWVEQLFPSQFDRISARIEDGYWEIVGGMWVESDAMLPSGEGFCRQFLHGQWYFQDKFDRMATVGWLPDSFGYNANLPQFMAKSGIDYFFFYKLNWNDTHHLPFKLFYWRAPDGSEVRTHLAYARYNNTASASAVDGAINSMRSKDPGQDTAFFPLGVGNHGGGIMRHNLIIMLALKNAGYNVQFGRADEFFEGVNWDIVDNVIEGDELYFEKHRGTYTTKAVHKKNIRELEYKLQNAELFASFAMLMGFDYPTMQLDDAWKRLMRDHFHDTMAGTCLFRVYKTEVFNNLQTVRNVGNGIINQSLTYLTSKIDTSAHGQGEVIAIFNPNGFETTRVVLLPVEKGLYSLVDSTGNEVPSQFSQIDQALIFVAKDIPAWGWKTYSLREGDYEGDASYAADANHLENDALSVDLDEDGHIVSLINKYLDFEFIEDGEKGNQLQLYYDKAKPFDSWDIGFDKYNDTPTVIDGATSVELVEDGPVRQVIEVHRQGEVESYVQRIILYAHADSLDLETHVADWGKPAHRFLKVAFPTTLVNQRQEIRHNIPYGHNVRVLDGHRADWEFVGQKWIDLTETYTAKVDPRAGLTLYALEKYGYDVANDGPGEGLSDGRTNILRLSLLKSGLSPLNTVLQSGGPVTDIGDFSTHYRLYPHAPDAKPAELYRRGEAYANPLVHFVTDAHDGYFPADGNFFTVESEGGVVLPTTLKVPHRNQGDRELILRLVEIAGDDSTVTLASTPWQPVTAKKADILEREESDELVDEGTLQVDVGHFSIDTVRVTFGDWSPDEPDDDDSADDDDSDDDDNTDDDATDDDVEAGGSDGDDDDGSCCG